MNARPDLLGLLPFADVADADPNALPFGDEHDCTPADCGAQPIAAYLRSHGFRVVAGASVWLFASDCEAAARARFESVPRARLYRNTRKAWVKEDER